MAEVNKHAELEAAIHAGRLEPSKVRVLYHQMRATEELCAEFRRTNVLLADLMMRLTRPSMMAAGSPSDLLSRQGGGLPDPKMSGVG